MLVRSFTIFFLSAILILSVGVASAHAQDTGNSAQNEDEDDFMSWNSLLPPYSAEGYDQSIRCFEVNAFGRALAGTSNNQNRMHYFQLGMEKSWIYAENVGASLGISQEQFKADESAMGDTELNKMLADASYYQDGLARCERLGLIYATALQEPAQYPSQQTNGQGSDQDQIQASIDEKFRAWSMSWMVDRYVPGSAYIDQLNCSKGGCEAYGQFTFTRGEARVTIPFDAQAPETSPHQFMIGRLCYRDSTTGTSDCVN